MRWTVHGERNLYESEWVTLALTDVEIPDCGPAHPSRRFDHHVIRMASPAAGVVVYDHDRGILLLWRHRFITNTWGWEVPAGKVDPGETPEVAAAREVREESGWNPGALTHLASYAPASGVGDHRYELFYAKGADRIGEPTDPSEAERIEWLSPDQVREEISAGRIDNGLTLTALLWCFTFGYF
jgi:8-oxo-dGTP pyrophosphatase MutT (NUDIX family)